MASDDVSKISPQPVAPGAPQTPSASAGDDTVSLVDLVAEGASPDSAGPVTESVAAIDQVLAVEAPDFAAELEALRVAGAPLEADVVVDSDVEEIVKNDKVEQASKGVKRLKLYFIIYPLRKIKNAKLALKSVWPWLKQTAFPAAKDGAIHGLKTAKSGALFAIGKVKALTSWFSKQKTQSKILIVSVVALAVGAAAMTRIALRGRFLPSLEKDFLYSFADVADAKYEIEEGEKWQDLNDPLLHPEHIVLLERLVVNLHNPGDGTNPMALLDLYVEAGSKDAAVELKDRDAEVRDMVLRTMEQMRYDELVTETGKNKLKVFLRKNLNDMLSKGRIRRIFFKSIVLKP